MPNNQEVEFELLIEVVQFPKTLLATMEHHGAPSLLSETIVQFIGWRKQNSLPPTRYATFNLLYNDPKNTANNDFQFDLGVAVDHDMSASDEHILMKTIPAGLCAKVILMGSDEKLGEIIQHLYSNWLPRSDYTLRDFPLFLNRVTIEPNIAEHQMMTEIYLPLQV